MSTEPKWTPGPWLIEKRCETIQEEGFYIGDDGSFVCAVHGYIDHPLNIANANLIAAAPELYSEGESSANTMEAVAAYIAGHGFVDMADELRLQAKTQRAVLAKARGEATS